MSEFYAPGGAHFPPKKEYKVGWWQWVLAIVLPIVGVICGIVALAKNKVGPGIGLIVTSAVAFLIWFVILLGMAADDAVEDYNREVNRIEQEYQQSVEDNYNCDPAIDYC